MNKFPLLFLKKKSIDVQCGFCFYKICIHLEVVSLIPTSIHTSEEANFKGFKVSENIELR